MPKETVLIIGLGEIGHTLFSLYKQKPAEFSVYGIDIDEAKMRELDQQRSKIPAKVDTLQICLPCTDSNKFTGIISNYASEYKPKLIINNSTVPPGTTLKIVDKCNCYVVHSPSRGVHMNAEHMLWEMKRWHKYIGGVTQEASKIAKNHFEKLGLKVKVLKSSKETELAKLFETTYRAWMITCFQEMHRISRFFDTDFNETADFLEDTHRQRYDRPVMFPGVIGGHCLIPNTELLLESYDSEVLKLILKSNKKRIEEMKELSIRLEAEKVAKRAELLQKELSGHKNLTLPQSKTVQNIK